MIIEKFYSDIFILYLLIINILAFIIYVADKIKSKKTTSTRRISEKNLLIISAIGGSIGAMVAVKVSRHKTRKLSFLLPFWVIVVLQVLMAWFLYTKLLYPSEV